MRQKLFYSDRPDVVYAIGDVHGCFDLLYPLQKKIEADAESESGTKCLIMLGDYLDRGPRSSLVIEELMQPMGAGIQRLCLAGNHEEMMLDFLHHPSKDHPWLQFGGLETLQSYGLQQVPEDGREIGLLLERHMPYQHVEFIAALPALISMPGLCFVHAGLIHNVPLEQQQDKHLLWLRPSEQASIPSRHPFITVHGHTPVRQVALVNNRLNVDTGAFMTGRLSAAKIKRDGTITVFHVD